MRVKSAVGPVPVWPMAGAEPLDIPTVRTACLQQLGARDFGVKRGELVRAGVAVISRQCVYPICTARSIVCLAATLLPDGFGH